jgi:hypothetical protein
MQRLTNSRTPDDILAAYTDFWQKAAEDYGHEITTMSKLMAGVNTKMVTAAQSAADEAVSASREAAYSRKLAPVGCNGARARGTRPV